MVDLSKQRPDWWKDATCYQVYPASFQDSNGDGVGDIPGVISRLDYLRDLGVDVIWLCPMYKSPQVDMGYDISDYEDVHRPYGTLEDMDRLIKSVHDRGMKLILDLVINHCSDQHAWFKESRSSKTSPKRDWFIWRAPRYDADGKRIPPCNWMSAFGGSMWEWDQTTEEYYLHYFCPEQPDFNWENEECRQAIYQTAIHFWMKRGIDGWRIDTVNKYSKPVKFVDAPISIPGSPWQPAKRDMVNGPRIHEFIKDMVKSGFDPYGHIMSVGEVASTDNIEDARPFVGASRHELNMAFDLDTAWLGFGKVRRYVPDPFTLCDLKRQMLKWQRGIEGTDMWATAFTENHDVARSVSRYGSDKPEFREASAKVLALMLTTLTGTLFIYQGQEIGMINVPRSWPIEEYKDVDALNTYEETRRESGGDPKEMRKILDGINKLGRDNARTPMQWNASSHAGFTTGKPWMRVHDEYESINVEKQLSEDDSPLKCWQRLLAFRKAHKEVMVHGIICEHDIDNLDTFTYTKMLAKSEAERNGQTSVNSMALIALNFSEKQQPIFVPQEIKSHKLELAIGTRLDLKHADMLEPYEGRVYWVQKLD